MSLLLLSSGGGHPLFKLLSDRSRRVQNGSSGVAAVAPGYLSAQVARVDEDRPYWAAPGPSRADVREGPDLAGAWALSASRPWVMDREQALAWQYVLEGLVH
jgi:hypothetical protein